MKKYFAITLMLVCSVSLYGQKPVKHLDRLPQQQRDSILIAVTKKTILKFAPNYYDETAKTPVITRYVGTKESEKNDGRKHGWRAGRILYSVSYPNTKEYLEKYPYAGPNIMSVSIWEDTGVVFGIEVKGLGHFFGPDTDPNSDKYIKHTIFK